MRTHDKGSERSCCEASRIADKSKTRYFWLAASAHSPHTQTANTDPPHPKPTNAQQSAPGVVPQGTNRHDDAVICFIHTHNIRVFPQNARGRLLQRNKMAQLGATA